MSAEDPVPILGRLYEAHVGRVSDKWSLYLTEYSRILDIYRDKPVRLLEIGVQNGGSLDIWGKFFPNARLLVGCDIDPLCGRLHHADPRIRVIVGDANDDSTKTRILEQASEFDVVIDDGSHRSGDICRSFGHYFPAVVPGGIFVVEDLHCSYWQHFEGGLFDPFSSISFFKRLADIPNHEHWGVPTTTVEYLGAFFAHHGFELDAATLAEVHSVEFVNSLCFVRKREASQNTLGRRVIAGTEEPVAQGHLRWQGTAAPRVDQSFNPWSAMQPSTQEQLQRIREEVATRDTQLVEQTAKIAEQERSLETVAKTVAQREVRIRRLQRLRAAEQMRALELTGSLVGREQQLADLRQLLAHRRDSLEALRKDVADRDRSISELRADIQRGEALLRDALGEQRALLAHSASTEARLRDDIAERDARIAVLEQVLAESFWERAARWLRRLRSSR